jgi:hypothetical protein
MTFALSARASGDTAQKLIGQVLYPRFPRALFGIDQLGKRVDEIALSPEFDLKPIRKAVADVVDALPKH